MNNFDLFIKRPKLAIIISIIILLVGILSMFKLPLEEYPSITPIQVVVSATYPGASSDVIEDTVASPIEKQLNGIENMIYMSSISQNGSYKLTLFFDINANPDMAIVNVQNELQLVMTRLPEEVRRYGVSVDKTTGGPGLVIISLKSRHNSYSPLFISNYANIYIKEELARIKGVGSVSVFGSSDYSMRIWLDANKMTKYKLAGTDVLTAIKNQNLQSAVGELGVEPLNNQKMIKFTMRTKGRLTDVSEFENIVVKAQEDGSYIKIKDVARVELGAENYSNFSRINGLNSAIITVSQLPNANAIDLSNKIQSRLCELKKNFPVDLEYTIERDETIYVRKSIHEVIESVFFAIILVGIVTYFFLGSLKLAFIPFAVIPISLFGVFPFLRIFGFSINLLILFGLVLAVGLVVDDAIVVLENTQRHIQEGLDVKKATSLTLQEVIGAVITTSLVLIAVFIPVSFIEGISGRMFRQFAICISSSICLSTLIALTLTPALCSIMLSNSNKAPKIRIIESFESLFNNIKTFYIHFVKDNIKNHNFTVIAISSFAVLTIFLLYIIPKGFLPQEDRGAIFAQIKIPEGSTASRTDNVTKEIENKIKEIKGVRTLITLVGLSGENTAFIVAQLDDWSKRKDKSLSMSNLLLKIRKSFNNYPKAIVAMFSPPSISGLGMYGGFEYQLLNKGNKNITEFYNEAQKLMKNASNNKDLATVYSSYSPNLPQLQVDINTEKAMKEGVDISEIYDTLAIYFAKSYVNDFNKFGHVFRVYLQASSEYREDINSLNTIYVKNKYNNMIPLLSIVKITNIVGPYARTRYNMYPAITINGNTKSGISSGAGMNIMEKISKDILPNDIGFEWSGTSLQEKQSNGKFLPTLSISLVFTYLFLVGLYESWSLPICVLLITPFAIFGGLFLQFMTGNSLDLYSQIGLIMLIGLSSKQAILIIEFAKNMHEKGYSIYESAIEASKLRFRAVMMTNIAFILGLLPLVFATGAGAASRHSVGLTVIGGMLFVSTLCIFLVPNFYVLINSFKKGKP